MNGAPGCHQYLGQSIFPGVWLLLYGSFDDSYQGSLVPLNFTVRLGGEVGSRATVPDLEELKEMSTVRRFEWTL